MAFDWECSAYAPRPSAKVGKDRRIKIAVNT
jgi:hypothetical protein